jgi:glycosyltransferase involved in cell wall biosynthesis
MRILAFYPYLPYPLNRGAYQRAFHLLKSLASEFEVDLLALSDGGEGLEHRGVFESFCHEVRIVSFSHPAWQKLVPHRLLNPRPSTIHHWRVPQVAAALNSALENKNYDAVHVLDLVLAQYLLDGRVDIPMVLDRTRVDLQYQLMEQKSLKLPLRSRLLNLENQAKLWRFEKAVARRCALQVVCGPDDKNFVRKHISRSVPIEVIANGIDLEYFNPACSTETRALEPTLLFCGAMDYNPNIDALRWYFSEMHELLAKQVPGLKVLLAGKNPGAEIRAYASQPGVVVTGEVPDVRPFYKSAWAQMVPLRIGGGTRLKIVESLGMGTPVVSTRIGAQGLDLVHDRDVLYADTAAEFVRQSARALQDEGLRASLEANGIQSVRTRLSWGKLGEDLLRSYRKHLHRQESAGMSAACPVSC